MAAGTGTFAVALGTTMLVAAGVTYSWLKRVARRMRA